MHGYIVLFSWLVSQDLSNHHSNDLIKSASNWGWYVVTGFNSSLCVWIFVWYEVLSVLYKLYIFVVSCCWIFSSSKINWIRLLLTGKDRAQSYFLSFIFLFCYFLFSIFWFTVNINVPRVTPFSKLNENIAIKKWETMSCDFS